MKIAILTSGILPVPAVQGGAVENLIDFYLEYNEKHKLHDITVYSVWHPNIEKHPSQKSDVNHYQYIDVSSMKAKIDMQLFRFFFIHYCYYHYTIEYFLHKAMKMIARQHYDMIVIENRPAYSLKLMGRTNAALIYHLHNEKLTPATEKCEEIYGAATSIITVSDFIRKGVQAIDSKNIKTHTVYNGIDLKAFSPHGKKIRTHKGLSTNDFVLVFSGRITKEKGILELIEAMNTLKSYSNIKLLVIGSSFYGNTNNDNDFAHMLREKSSSLKERIFFTDFVPYNQMPDYLRMADVAVIPSVWDDPFPTTVLEAQAMGLPIITTIRGGIPEEVTTENAILLDTNEHFVDHLSAAILDLYQNPEKRIKMATASLERSKKFDKETYAKNFFKALITILFLLLPLTTHAQNDKLSMWLREKIAVEGVSGNTKRAESEMLTTAFVRTSETLTEEMLIEYGGTIYAQLGDISIITIPLSQIGRLTENPAVLRVEANRRADATLDTVPLVSNILPVYQATPQHQAFTGNGVVVGLVDIGFDLTHPTFYNNMSLSDYRIKAFWDQLAQHDQATGKLPVGRDYTTKNDILSQGCAIDGKSQGHGTHTAGIAAGSGYDSPYRGVAYESDLCLVANAVTSDTSFIAPQDYYLYTSATDALGFKYIFDYAEQQKKPCVVSFSEGYTPYMDEDDLLYNDFLERLIGPGRIFVASAGNESRELTYFDKPVGKEQAGAFLKTGRNAPLYRIKSEKPVTLTLYAYKDSNTPTHQLQIAADDERWNSVLIDTLFIDNDTLSVVINSYPSAFDQQGMIAMVQLYSDVALYKLPPIALVIGGKEQQATVIGSYSNAFANLDTDPRWNDAKLGYNVLSPGCLKAPICVASTSHRTGFKNMEGDWVQYLFAGEEAGQWSPFSSIGPTLDGRNKPDVSAPGRCIVSAYSSYYLEENPTATSYDVAHFDVNGRTYPWRVDSGTSMSTPVVAGIIALWLQAKPDLTRDDIMGVIQRTCRHPEEDLDYPNNKYGYGEIDAYRGLLDILGITAIKEISQHEPHDAAIWAQEGLLHVVFDTIPEKPITLSIYSTAGTRIYQTSITTNQSDVTLPLPTFGKGIYVVQLGNLGSTLIRI